MYLDELFTFEVADVPMDEAQTVTLGQTSGDRSVYFPREVVLLCTESPSPVGLCTMSVGTNSPSYNNILPATLLTSLSALNKLLSPPVGPLVNGVGPGVDIKAKISIAASNGGVMRIVLVGLYGDYL